MLHMRRQEFFGGAAAVWPGIGEAQQAAAMPRIGALMRPRRDPEAQTWAAAFRELEFWSRVARSERKAPGRLTNRGLSVPRKLGGFHPGRCTINKCYFGQLHDRK
jgi:hypothetical protein